MIASNIRASIKTILPSFAPVLIERGVPGYETEQLADGEIRLIPEQLRPLLIASAFIGTINHAVDRGLDYDRVADALTSSIQAIADVTSEEKAEALALVERFHSFRIIREEHSLDDWLCEALWPAYQRTPYAYPSAMSGAIDYALGIGDTLQKCTVEY